MGKEYLRGAYDPLTALNNAGRLMGMELHEAGPLKLQGGYYLNGERHPWRRDKLKVFVGRGCVWVAEEGDRCISLPQWLIEYGGAEDFKDALRMIKGESQAIVWNREVRQKAVSEVRYVEQAALMGAKAYDLRSCALFRWMAGMFGESRVREVWDRYNVTTDSHGNCVFWYTDQDGRVLFDKRIAYKEDGHRDKSFFPGRQYRVAEGYSGRCYFGSNTLDDDGKVFVVESEKTCLLVALYYGRQCVATGGKGNLFDVEDRMVLLPDMDARDVWEAKGAVWPWWEHWGVPTAELDSHADIGDMIEYKLRIK